MASGDTSNLNEGSITEVNSYRQPSEEILSLSASGKGSDLNLTGIHNLDKTRASTGVFTAGPYILDESMVSLSSRGMDGAVSSRISKNEGRFVIPGPYPTAKDESEDLTNGSASSGLTNGDQIYDPEGFGDELEETGDSGFAQVSPPSRPPPSVPQDTVKASPAAPRHAPPPPPDGGSHLLTTSTHNPPITVTQAQRRRAQSETSPPSSPPPVGGYLSPPSNESTVHRKSSPPAPKLDQLPSSMNPVMPKLQQRHTLQVPQMSPHGGTKEFSGGDDSTGRNSSPTVSNRRTSMNLMRRHSRSLNSDLHLSEVPQDEDAARRSELMKQKLVARRKRKEEEDEDRVLVGTRVDQNHQNWVTAYNMLTGIRFTVSRTNAKIRDQELTEAEFNAKHKYAFDVTGSELTPSAKYDFKFKDYAPQVFKELRSLFGIDPADYLVSLTSKILLSELASPGKSKSFFYFSRDYKYIIKTVHHAEHKLLRKVLPRYFQHVKDNPNTLLSQFYGLHRIKSTWGAHKTHFVVMNNLFPPHRDIHQTYDLKGSTVGRELKEEDLEKNPRATLKDLNWMRRNQHLAFGPMIKAQFIQQMERDVELLKELGIMDYSLLVGIHDLNRGNEEGLRDKTLRVYHPGGNSEKGDDNGGKETPNLARSPSNAERTRAARELRATLRKERPVPMNQSGIDMPENNVSERISRVFTKDDGGIQAEHENGAPGNEIYYLGIIDCLTKYGMVKRIEHFVKGLSSNKNAISAVKPDAYGDRFVAFMKGISKTDEEVRAEERQRQEEDARQTVEKRSRRSISMSLRSQSQPRHSSSFPITAGGDGTSERRSEQQPRSPTEEMTPQQQAAERKARRSGENQTAEEHQRTLGTVRASNAQDGGNITLPVLEEVNTETNSSGGRSRNRSQERGQSKMTRQISSRSRSEAGPRSVSPSQQTSTRGTSVPRMPDRPAPQPPVYGGRPPPTPPKDFAVPQLGSLSTDDFGGRFVVSPPEGEA